MKYIRPLTLLLITAGTVLAFTTDPPLAMLGAGSEASRIFYFHVPMAQISFIAFITSAVYAIAFLRTRRIDHDHAAVTAAELGLLFAVVALITGALWARQAWGAYWNWDPRKLLLFILILFYGAFFALRHDPL